MFTKKKSAKLRKDVYILCFGIMVTMMGNMVYPMLTIILQQKFSMSATNIALILAADSISLFIASFLGGRIADKYNRKWNIIICDLFTVVMYGLCFILPLSYLSIVLIIFGGSFQQMEIASYNTLITEMTDEENRDRGFSVFYLCFNIGAFISTAAAGFLINEYTKLVFLLDGAGVFVSTIIIMLFVKYKRTAKTEEEAEEAKGMGFSVFKNTPLLLLFLVIMCLNEIVHNEYSYLIPMELDRILAENGAKVFGTLISVSCVIVVFMTTPITNLLHKKEHLHKLQLSNIFQIAGYAVFGIGIILYNIPLFYVGFIIYIFGEICDAISYEPYLMHITPERYRGRIDGIFSMTMKIAVMLFNLIVGTTYDRSPVIAWSVLMVTGVMAIVLTKVLKHKEKTMVLQVQKNKRK